MADEQTKHDFWNLTENIRATAAVLSELSVLASCYADDITKADVMALQIEGLLANIKSLIEAAQAVQVVSRPITQEILETSVQLKLRMLQYKSDLQSCVDGSEDDICLRRPTTIYKNTIPHVIEIADRYHDIIYPLRFKVEAESLMQTKDEEPIEPLNDYEKRLVLYFTEAKGLGDVSYLNAFLCQNCGVADPKSYRWKDKLAALEIYRESNKITRQAIENYNPITTKFCFSDDAASFDGLPLKIPNEGHRSILKLLVENFGCLVSFDKIESTLGISDQEKKQKEENRRKAISDLRKAISDLPFEIESEKKIGAMIRLKE